MRLLGKNGVDSGDRWGVQSKGTRLMVYWFDEEAHLRQLLVNAITERHYTALMVCA